MSKFTPFHRTISFVLAAALALGWVPPSYALKPQETAQSSGLEELENALRRFAQAAGLPLPGLPTAGFATAVPAFAGLEEIGSLPAQHEILYDFTKQFLSGRVPAGEDAGLLTLKGISHPQAATEWIGVTAIARGLVGKGKGLDLAPRKKVIDEVDLWAQSVQEQVARAWERYLHHVNFETKGLTPGGLPSGAYSGDPADLDTPTISDVVEDTKKFTQGDPGSSSFQLEGPGAVTLGSFPDEARAMMVVTHINPALEAEVLRKHGAASIKELLDPELPIDQIVHRVAELNAVPIHKMDVTVLTGDPSDTDALEELQRTYHEMQFEALSGGTFQPALAASLGVRDGRVRLFARRSGMSEAVFNTIVASLFSADGAIAIFRPVSEGIKGGNDKRYFWTSHVMEKMKALRPQNLQELQQIEDGKIIFSSRQITQPVVGAYTFLTPGRTDRRLPFDVSGVQEIGGDNYEVHTLAFASNPRQPGAGYLWLSRNVYPYANATAGLEEGTQAFDFKLSGGSTWYGGNRQYDLSGPSLDSFAGLLGFEQERRGGHDIRLMRLGVDQVGRDLQPGDLFFGWALVGPNKVILVGEGDGGLDVQTEWEQYGNKSGALPVEVAPAGRIQVRLGRQNPREPTRYHAATITVTPAAGLEEVPATARLARMATEKGPALRFSIDATNDVRPEFVQYVGQVGADKTTLNPNSVGTAAAKGQLDYLLRDLADQAAPGAPFFWELVKRHVSAVFLPVKETSIELDPTATSLFELTLDNKNNPVPVMEGDRRVVRAEFRALVGKDSLGPGEKLDDLRGQQVHDWMVRQWVVQALEIHRLGMDHPGRDGVNNATVKIGHTQSLEPVMGFWGVRVGLDVMHVLAVLGIHRNFTLGFTPEDAGLALKADRVVQEEWEATRFLDLKTVSADEVLSRLRALSLPMGELEKTSPMAMPADRLASGRPAGRAYFSLFASRVDAKVNSDKWKEHFTEDQRKYFGIVNLLYVMLTRYNDEIPWNRAHGQVVIPASLEPKVKGQPDDFYFNLLVGWGPQVVPTASRKVVEAFNARMSGSDDESLVRLATRIGAMKQSYAQKLEQSQPPPLPTVYDPAAAVNEIATLFVDEGHYSQFSAAQSVVESIVTYPEKNRRVYDSMMNELYPEGDDKFTGPHLNAIRTVDQKVQAVLSEAAGLEEWVGGPNFRLYRSPTTQSQDRRAVIHRFTPRGDQLWMTLLGQRGDKKTKVGFVLTDPHENRISQADAVVHRASVLGKIIRDAEASGSLPQGSWESIWKPEEGRLDFKNPKTVQVLQSAPVLRALEKRQPKTGEEPGLLVFTLEQDQESAVAFRTAGDDPSNWSPFAEIVVIGRNAGNTRFLFSSLPGVLIDREKVFREPRVAEPTTGLEELESLLKGLSGNYAAKREAVEGLIKLGQEGVRALLKASVEPSKISSDADFATRYLTPDAVPYLLVAVGDEDEKVRAQATGLLGSIAEHHFLQRSAVVIPSEETLPLIVSRLRRLLADPVPEVRAAAVWSLGPMGAYAAPAVEELLTIYREDFLPTQDRTDVFVIHQAAKTLERIGSYAPDRIISGLHSSEELDRLASVHLIGVVPASKSISKLREILQGDPSPRVRKAAAIALRSPNFIETIPDLRKALLDADPEVRQEAAATLVSIRFPTEGPYLYGLIRGDPVWQTRQAAVWGLGNNSPRDSRLEEVIQVLRHVALADPHVEVRKTATIALGWFVSVKPSVSASAEEERIYQIAVNALQKVQAVTTPQAGLEEAQQALDSFARSDKFWGPGLQGVPVLPRAVLVDLSGDHRLEQLAWALSMMQSKNEVRDLAFRVVVANNQVEGLLSGLANYPAAADFLRKNLQPYNPDDEEGAETARWEALAVLGQEGSVEIVRKLDSGLAIRLAAFFAAGNLNMLGGEVIDRFEALVEAA